MSSDGGNLLALPKAPAPRPSRLSEEGSGVIGLVLGGIFLALVIANADGSAPVLGGIALGATTLLPGVLAFLARRRSALYLAAGVLGMPLAFISMSGVALPLLLPAGMALVAYGRRSADGPPSRVAAPLIALVALFLGVASIVSLLIHEDPRSTATENSYTYSSDVVTTPEAAVSLGLSAFAIVTTWTLARPRPDEPFVMSVSPPGIPGS